MKSLTAILLCCISMMLVALVSIAGAQEFGPAYELTAGNGPYGLCSSDIDGDGIKDIAGASGRVTSRYVTFPPKTGPFETSILGLYCPQRRT
ncbi:MAG: VCBS repeat-containing protein, partial [bacterium]|nr:VCBS repeat-containing protein [bacterium]